MKDIKSLNQKNIDELNKELNFLREKLVRLRFERETGAIKKVHKFGKLQKSIARIVTLIKNKEEKKN